MNLSKEYIISLYQVKKLYEDFDSESGISEDEYIKLVDDVISYDLQLRVRQLAERNYAMLNKVIDNGHYSSKKAKRKMLYLQKSVSEMFKRDDSVEYLENMLNAGLARLAQYRKSKSTEMMSKFDTAFIELFSEFADIDEAHAHILVE